jgi:histidinol dehydrogenase
MPLRLDTRSAEFQHEFGRLLAQKREIAEDVDHVAQTIVAEVIARKDEALVAYSLKFDRVDLARIGLRIGTDEVDTALASCSREALEALRLAQARIVSFHERQKPGDLVFADSLGVELGWRWRPIDSVGLYVPGGTASYPSSVLMNAIPAKVAGVSRLVMVVPAPDGHIEPLVLAAARLAGIDEIYRVGGAQAIAAMAYGTETIAPVSKIVGPGNAFVAAAKRRVFGTVGIDMIAGPSEVLIIADDTADPEWIAADLLAQAEHDSAAQSILITDSADLADAVEAAVARQVGSLPRRDIAAASWRDFGAIVLVTDLSESVGLVDRVAPEHLEIIAENSEVLSSAIHNAGAIFLGPYTPEAIGDYVGGSNHVLPTARSARFSSGLGVLDFMKRTSILKCTAESLATLGPAAVALGHAEGLDAHARSVQIRLTTPPS